MSGSYCYPLAAIRPQARPGDPYAPYKFFASFTGTGGTALASYTPEKGAAGTQVSGTWQLTSNKVVMTDNTDGRLFTFDASGTNDCNISCDITSDDWAMRFPGVIFRYQDSTNFLLLQIQTTALILYKCVAGSFTMIDQVTGLSPVNGTTYTLAISASGTGITFACAALSAVKSTTSSQFTTSTKFGFRYGGASPNPSNATFWDNLNVA